ncbi:hypothetical protein HNY73_007227 [Argiope bruennichi]|uniref:Uncharacterized protein n=1 Tax=Argiope bruennichi TaxID=94029 RepID=A0A8T0FEB1_ARGBR|nr:hypothetical protein HNY73_007227 [Argiope bruennichi]
MNWFAQNGPRVWDQTTYEILPYLIDFEPLMLFVEEIIDYSLCQHYLSNWIPPMNLEYLRLKHFAKRYFQDSIGEAICHSCTERDAVSLAVELGFNEKMWLNLEPSEAREQLVGYLWLLLTHSQGPKESAIFQMFSLGCYLVKEAMKRKLNALANEVVQALVRTCCLQFPYEKQYTKYAALADSYNLGHRLIHSRQKGEIIFSFKKMPSKID